MKHRIYTLLALLLMAVGGARAEVIDFQLPKALRSGRYTGLCVPFRMDASQVGELYAVATIDGYIGRIYPVSSLPAGQPCVVRTSSNISVLQVEADSVRADALVEWPLLWGDGVLTPQTGDYSWTFTAPEGKVTKSSNLVFLNLNLLQTDFAVCVENGQLRAYLDNVHYEDSEDEGLIGQYKRGAVRLDHPNPVVIPLPLSTVDSLTLRLSEGSSDFSQADTMTIEPGRPSFSIYNLTPQRTYYYQILQQGAVTSQGRFVTTGRVRMIKVPEVFNIRDLGGWTIDDGRQTVYGKLFRGSELNGKYNADSAGIASLRALGIEAEADLRYRNENPGAGTSAFGFLDAAAAGADEATYLFTNNFPSQASSLRYTSYLNRIANALNFIVRNLRQGRPVYFHCIWGADRTGLLAMLLEGLLGFSYDQIMKDYELTSFYPGANKPKSVREDVIMFVSDFEGNTLQEKFNTFFRTRVNVSQETIDDFRTIMFGGTPVYNGIEAPMAAAAQPVQPARYDLTGRRADSSARGMTIERMPDGRTRKVVQATKNQ